MKTALLLVLCLVMLSGCASLQERAAAQQFIDEMFISSPQCESGVAVLYQSGPPTCLSADDARRLLAEGFRLPGGNQ